MVATECGQKMMRKILMISPKPNLFTLNTERVMVIILQLTLIVLIGCGEGEKAESNYELPDTFEHPAVGKAIGISPLGFIDTLNNGAMGDVYYFKEGEPENPSDVVQVPEMKSVTISEMTQIFETLNSKDPVFLISLYGSDARKLAQMNTSTGLTIYYVVGGSYKLAEVIRQQRLEILPRPQLKNTGK